MNEISLCGHVRSEPIHGTTKDKKPYLMFFLSVRQGATHSWFLVDCRLFGNYAGAMGQYLHKGRTVFVAGSLCPVPNKEVGTFYVLVRSVELIGNADTGLAGNGEEDGGKDGKEPGKETL